MQFRLALSHREKARALRDQADRARDEGAVDEAHYAAVNRLYSEQQALAESAVARLRGEQRGRIEDLEAQIRELELDQARLLRRAAAREIKPERANEGNQRLARRAQELNDEIAERRRLIEADSPEAVGGFLDLPLNEYLRPSGEKPPKPTPVDLILAFLLPLAASLATFLPWIAYEGRTFSLLHLDKLYLEFQSSLPAGLIPKLWIAYVLVPLLAFPLAAVRHPRRVGWGLMTVGSLMMFSGLLQPMLTVVGYPQAPTLLELLATIRMGAVVYCGGGLALLILGVRRFRPAAVPLRTSLWRAARLSAAIAAVLVACIVVFAFMPKGVAMRLTADAPDPATGTVWITCTNTGGVPVTILVPRPEEGVSRNSGLTPNATYGFIVEVREKGRTSFQLFPATEGLWRSQGMPFQGAGRTTVEPGSRAAIGFQAPRIKERGADPEAVRIIVMHGRDERVFTYDVPPYTPPPPQPAANAPKPAQPAVEPPAVPIPEIPPTSPGITIRYKGGVEDRVSIGITEQGSDAESSKSVRLDDEIIPGWRLESIHRSPKAIVIRNTRTGNTITIERGTRATVNPASR